MHSDLQQKLEQHASEDAFFSTLSLAQLQHLQHLLSSGMNDKRVQLAVWTREDEMATE